MEKPCAQVNSNTVSHPRVKMATSTTKRPANSLTHARNTYNQRKLNRAMEGGVHFSQCMYFGNFDHQRYLKGFSDEVSDSFTGLARRVLPPDDELQPSSRLFPLDFNQQALQINATWKRLLSYVTHVTCTKGSRCCKTF